MASSSCAPDVSSEPDQRSTMESMKQESEVVMEMGAHYYYIPKDVRGKKRNKRKGKPKGEDAYFLYPEGQSFGVADGVGSWARKGIDAGEYARLLMENSIFTFKSQPKVYIDPKKVLIEAHSRTVLPGSSTACLVTLTNQIVEYASVGDSGLMVLRNGKSIHKSTRKQTSFNAPCQLGYNGPKFTPPSEAIEGKINVLPGDIIVAATDGLFDNMFESEIEKTVMKEMEQGASPQQLATTLVTLARSNSLNRYFISPFSIAAMEVGQDYRGGKIDDITVVVAFIRPQSHLPTLDFGACNV